MGFGKFLLLIGLTVLALLMGAYAWLLYDLFTGRGCGGPQQVQCPNGYSCWQAHASTGYGQCVHSRLWQYLPLIGELPEYIKESF